MGVNIERVTPDRFAEILVAASEKSICTQVESLGMTSLLEDLQDEVERLQEWLADYQNDFKTVMNEECAPDEKHCTCVLHLRAGIKQVRGLAQDLIDAFDGVPYSQEKANIGFTLLQLLDHGAKE